MCEDATVASRSQAGDEVKRVMFQTQEPLSDSDHLPLSTRWHRKHGRPSRRDKAVKQQLLTPCEEQALVDHILRWSRNGYPIPAKSLPFLAAVILRQRVNSSKSSTTCDICKPPSKKWRLAFYKRHPNVKSRRLKAIDWKRHDFHIYDKMVDWFQVIGRELQMLDVLQENVYNMDETGILLSAPTSMEVLVGRDDLRNYRGAGVQRQLITAIECISADGRSLAPLVIWPAATQRSTWTTHPTPDWHFACSETGYTNSAISLEWMQKVFDASTRGRANGRPRLLISDGFGTHESLEVLTFCYENNIILCRLPSHTSHKLQPCDVGVFGPLKAAYRVEA